MIHDGGAKKQDAPRLLAQVAIRARGALMTW